MASPTQSLIQIHIDPSLQIFNIPLAQYLSINPQYDRLVVSAFIFDVPSGEALESGRQRRLLIVQRAAHERSYANKWELPGGSSEASDPTILHSLAREVFEETGLKMKKVLRKVGNVMEFTSGWGSRQKRWAKLNFEIDVTEIQDQGQQSACVADNDSLRLNSANQSHDHKLEPSSKREEQELTITIDPEEHQSFAWTTMEELKTEKYAIATPEQQQLMLEAFQRGEKYHA
jgi:8-oxo-dGTP pyrophosphatase MutT (NUDIX family)